MTNIVLDDAELDELEEATAALACAHRMARWAERDGDTVKHAAAIRLIESWKATVAALLAAEPVGGRREAGPVTSGRRGADRSLFADHPGGSVSTTDWFAVAKDIVNEHNGYRLWVNDARTVLVRVWLADGRIEVATRETPEHTWGPPVTVSEERV